MSRYLPTWWESLRLKRKESCPKRECNHVSVRGRVVDAIHELSRLREDWDTYGASAPDPAAINSAIRFVEKTSDDQINRLPVPAVSASRNGEVILGWQGGPLELDIVFSASGGRYTVIDPDIDAVVKQGSVCDISSIDQLFGSLPKAVGQRVATN